jgi:hypothetical protein
MRTTSPIGDFIVVIAMIAISGCTATTPGASGKRPTDSPTATTPKQSSATATPAATARAGDAWLLVGRPGTDELSVILDSTLEEQTAVPLGVPGKQWGWVYTATPSASTTVVQYVVIQPGFGGDGQTIDGRWVFPTIGADPVPVGVSADGSTLVLVEADVPHGPAGVDRTTSRFAVLDAYLISRHEPNVIELAGAFDFDALSPDGSLLYVAEQIPGPVEGRYQVRVVETATGRLRPDVIVDKRNLNEQMAGYPVDQERRADGMVLTLYRGAEHPFIHALSSVDAWAVCIDLPDRGFDDVDATTDWGIASSARRMLRSTPPSGWPSTSTRRTWSSVARSTSSLRLWRRSASPSSVMATWGRLVDAWPRHRMGPASMRPARAGSSDSVSRTWMSSSATSQGLPSTRSRSRPMALRSSR